MEQSALIRATRGSKGKRMYVNRLEGTAYHEAGHVMMYHVLERKYLYVTIESDGDNLGHVMNDPSTIPADLIDLPAAEARMWAEGEILICLAGAVAESIRRGRNYKRGAWGDHDTAVERAAWLDRTYGVWDYHIRYLEALAKATIRSYWPSVDLVAKALLERRRLTYEDVVALLAEDWGLSKVKAELAGHPDVDAQATS